MSNPTAFQVALLVIAILMIVVVFTWDAADLKRQRRHDERVRRIAQRLDRSTW